MIHANSIKSYRDLPPGSVLEVAREIQSLRDRANAINAAADGLLYFITPQTTPTATQGSLFDQT